MKLYIPIRLQRKLRRGLQVTILPTYACNYSCSYCGNIYKGEKHPSKSLKHTEQEWKDYLEQLDHVLRLGGSRIKEIIFNGGEPTIIPWFNSFCKWILMEKKWILTVYTNLSRVDELCALPETHRLVIRGSYHDEQANPQVFAINWNYLLQRHRVEVGELGSERQLEKYVKPPKQTILKPFNDAEVQEHRADTLRVGPDQAIYLTCWGVSKANLK